MNEIIAEASRHLLRLSHLILTNPSANSELRCEKLNKTFAEQAIASPNETACEIKFDAGALMEQRGPLGATEAAKNGQKQPEMLSRQLWSRGLVCPNVRVCASSGKLQRF